MVVGNIVTIFGIKVRELYLEIKENNRIKRLRWISEVEQKYLFFDYRKFFGPQAGGRQNLYIQEELAKGFHLKQKDKYSDLRPTDLFKHLDDTLDDTTPSHPLPENGPKFDDSISPDAYAGDHQTGLIKPPPKVQEADEPEHNNMYPQNDIRSRNAYSEFGDTSPHYNTDGNPASGKFAF